MTKAASTTIDQPLLDVAAFRGLKVGVKTPRCVLGLTRGNLAASGFHYHDAPATFCVPLLEHVYLLSEAHAALATKRGAIGHFTYSSTIEQEMQRIAAAKTSATHV